MNIPKEVADLKNTHLMLWLEDGYNHCQSGSKDWCQSYLNSAHDYIEALEAALAAAPEPVGVAPGDWAFFLTRLDGLAEKNDTLFKQVFNEFKANVTMGKKK